MKPLVLWARWHDAKIELHGRSETEIWGIFNYWKEERTAPFRFKIKEKALETEDKMIQLDDVGIEIKS